MPSIQTHLIAHAVMIVAKKRKAVIYLPGGHVAFKDLHTDELREGIVVATMWDDTVTLINPSAIMAVRDGGPWVPELGED